MSKLDKKAAMKELAEIKVRVAYLENIVNAAENREPKKLDYDITELAAKIKNGTLEEELVVGDYIDFKVASGDVVRAYVVGKNHDDKVHGGKAEYTFACYIEDVRVRMNDTSDNGTSWKNSKMRNKHMASIGNLLPSSLLMYLSPINKKTSIGHDNGKILETTDTLFLFSEVEITGKTAYSKGGEGTQYEFFKSNENRKTLIKNWAWTRSPYRNSCFCVVCDDGSSCNCADGFYDVLFGFCI